MTSAVLIGAIIIAFVKAVKTLSPKVTGLLTMVVAVAIGMLIAVIDTNIGLDNISIAQGIWIALAAVGVHTLASDTNTKSS